MLLSQVFDAVEAVQACFMEDLDTMIVWVEISGELRYRGKRAIVEWGAGLRNGIWYSDDPTLVVVVSELRFFTIDEVADLTSHIGPDRMYV